MQNYKVNEETSQQLSENSTNNSAENPPPYECAVHSTQTKVIPMKKSYSEKEGPVKDEVIVNNPPTAKTSNTTVIYSHPNGLKNEKSQYQDNIVSFNSQ